MNNEFYVDYYDDGSPDGGFDANFDGEPEEFNVFDHEELVLSVANDDVAANNLVRNQNLIANNLPLTTVKKIAFKIYTHDEVISNSELLVMNIAFINSLFLGAQESLRCGTCNQDRKTCLGHMGHVLLPYTPSPLFEASINTILSMFCTNCDEFRLVSRKNNRDTLSTIATGVRSRACPYCKDKPLSVYITPRAPKPAKDHIVVQYEDVFEKFSRISKKDAVQLLNMHRNHPQDMILRSINVLPYNVRPQQMDDDVVLTRHLESLYRTFVKNVNTLCLSFINLLEPYVDQQDEMLVQLNGLISRTTPRQIYELKASRYIDRIKDFTGMTDDSEPIREIYELINYSIPNSLAELINGSGKNSKQKTAGVKDKLQSKDGLLRNNMMGRRTNFVLRTVAAPGGLMNLEEIGIPQSAQENLTIPVSVREYNIDALALLMVNGDILLVHKMRDDGTLSNITISEVNRNSMRLSIGDIVHRKISNGDVVLVNRQPTLNKQNFVQLFVKIIKDNVIRINLSITSPLNADFDGDELNVHVPQGIEARADAALFSVTNNFINETNGTAMFGIVYNSLSGCYMMTNNQNNEENRRLYRRTQNKKNADAIGFMEDHDIIMEKSLNQAYMDPGFMVDLRARCERQGQVWGTGHSLLSLAFPPDFWYIKRGKNPIEIRDGILMHGILDTDEIGRKDNNILTQLHSFFRDYIPRTMSVIQFVANNYLLRNTLSINYNHCVTEDISFTRKIDEQIASAEENLRKILQHIPHTENEKQDQQELILNQMNRAGKTPKDFQKSFPQGTPLMIMSTSGAKGNIRNLTQMSMGLGLQRVDGKMLKKSLPGGRTLPTYRTGEETLKNLGFVRNSFVVGLDPEEYFYHNMTMRESLVDTSIGTQSTGALNHNLNKALENVKSDGSGAIVSPGRLVMNVYGGDGFRPGGLVNVRKADGTGFTSTFVDIEKLAHQLNNSFINRVTA